MSESWTCNECDELYDDSDGNTDENLCFKCIDKIYFEELKRRSNKFVKSVMKKADILINWVKKA